jgi:intracellular sulfur oxidation DsrE/DsrF family protein
MANIRNHLRAEPDTKIVVVANGDGIRFLLAGARERNGKPFDAAVSALAGQGVEFRVCRNTLSAHGVPESQLLPEAKLVPSGVVEVARLQAREGFVYLRP